MTEQEAVYCLKAKSGRYPHLCEECRLYGQTGCDHCYNDANDVAIKALEEISLYNQVELCLIPADVYKKQCEELEQYRALGLTPELIEAMQGHNIAMINDLAEYQALGTVEELRVAKGVYDKMYNTAKEMFKDDENRQREFREKLSKSFSRK